MALFIRNSWGRVAHSSDIREMLGLGRKAKLPEARMDPVIIQGITVWVEPAKPAYRTNRWTGQPVRVKSSTHRVMARCPVCGEEMSVGRLQQHAKIHAVK